MVSAMANTQDSGSCPAEHEPGRGRERGYFEAFSDLTPQEVQRTLVIP
jgi:hypothetical protein